MVDLDSCRGHRICHGHGLASGHGNHVVALLHNLDLDCDPGLDPGLGLDIYLSLNRNCRGCRRLSDSCPSIEIRRCPWALVEAEIASEIFGMTILPWLKLIDV